MNVRVGFIEGVYVEFNVIAQHLLSGAFERQAIEHRQAVRRNRRPEPLYDIALIVVMRRLDEYQAETLLLCRFRFDDASVLSGRDIEGSKVSDSEL